MPDEKVTRHGQTLTARVWALIDDAGQAAGIPAGTIHVSQGGFKGTGGASASAGTHDVGDVFDLRTWNLDPAKVLDLVVELRRRNVCAWFRSPAFGWTSTGPHIHGVVRDSVYGLSPSARAQVAAYDAGRNGLANNAADPFPRPPQQHWEDGMALSDEDVARIADAVWTRAVEVEGKKRKMGAMLIALFKGTAPPATDEPQA